MMYGFIYVAEACYPEKSDVISRKGRLGDAVCVSAGVAALCRARAAAVSAPSRALCAPQHRDLPGWFILIELAAYVVLRLRYPNDARTPKDEREQLIDLKALRLAAYVYFAGSFIAIFVTIHLAYGGAGAVGVSVLMAFVVAEIVNYTARIIYYRLGSWMGGSAITNIIRRLRFEHREMTQQELAERIGVTRQTVNAIEAGKYSPSLEVAFRIAEVFGLRVDEVFGYQKRAHK